MRLIHRLLLLALVPLAFAGVGLLVLGIWLGRNALDEEAGRNARQQLEQNAGQIHAYFAGHLQALNALAATSLIHGGGKKAEIAAQLDAWQRSFPDVIGIGYITPDGTMLLPDGRGLQVSDREYFQRAMRGESPISPVLYSRQTGRQLVTAAVPIRDGGSQIRGVLSAAITLNHIQGQIAAVRVGARGFAVLSDAGGTVLAEGAPPRVAADMGPLMARLRHGAAQPLTVRLGGDRWRAYAAQVPDTDWTLVMCYEESAILAKVRRAGWYTAALLLACALLGAGVAAGARRYVSDPVERLREAQARVAAGDLTARAAIGRNDELGALGSSFNAMAATLEAAYRRIAENEAVLRAQFERTNIGLGLVSPQGLFLRVNRRLAELLGYTEAELPGMNRAELTDPEDRAERQRPFQRLLNGEIDAYEHDERLLRKDGSSVNVHMTGSCDRAPDGTPRFVIASYQDLTERDLAAQALAESEKKFRTIFEDAPYSILITDDEGRCVDVNKRMARDHGMARDEIRGQTVNADPRFFHPAGPERHVEWLNQLRREGSVANEELELVRPCDGARRWGLLSMRSITLGGRPCVITMLADTTEIKRLEEQLRRSQKMEAIGQLAGGVAHDFNNLLTVINGYGALLAKEIGGHEKLREHVDQICKAGLRAAALTQQLLAFSRRQVIQPKAMNLNESIAEVIGMLCRSLGDDIVVEHHLAPDLATVMADPLQLQQVLVNLAINARDAMPHGGRLVFETANVELAGEYTEQHPEVPAGSYVLLAVTDSGTGIDAETQRRIFEPFFTTKGKGHGTGLGLATVHGIVRQAGGWIWVYSELGKGTTFKIYLPQITGQAERVVLSTAPTGTFQGRETLLIVEDQEAVRRFAALVLRSCGYRVLEAGDGAEALSTADACTERIDLLVTDVEMPGLSGREVAERMLLRRPEMKVLYTSGYTEDVIVSRGALKPGVRYLPKPFTPHALSAKVREILA